MSVHRDVCLLTLKEFVSQLRAESVYFDFIDQMCSCVHAGAVDELGDMPYYAEHCAAMLAVTYSSGQGMQRNIVSDFIIQSNLRSYTNLHLALKDLCINSVHLCEVQYSVK